MKDDEYNPKNGFMTMPQEYLGQFYDACNEPCDMLIGPCACGGWHQLHEWPEDVRHAAVRKFPQAEEESKEYLDEHPWERKCIGCRRRKA